MKFKVLLVTCLLFITSYLPAAGRTHVDEPTHGTINILLANPRGIVLITDSRASNLMGIPVHDRSQKLFALDQKTVCSIAGFATDPGPVVKGLDGSRSKQLSLQIAGSITAFSKQISSRSSEMPFMDKIQSLSGLLAMELEELKNEEYYASIVSLPDPVELDLLFAGLDTDGKMRIAKRVITVTKNSPEEGKPFFVGTVAKIKDVAVDSQFVYLTAGLGPATEAVESRLKHPEKFLESPSIRVYERAMDKHKSADMTASELSGLADDLENAAVKSAADLNLPVIGGPTQKATLVGRESFRLSLPPDLIQSESPHMVAVASFGDMRNSSMPAMMSRLSRVPIWTAYVETACDHAAIFLDNSVIIGGTFSYCDFYFNGGPFFIDPNDVAVKSGNLVTGPQATAEQVKEALRLFPELTQEPYTKLGMDLSRQDRFLWHIDGLSH